MGKEYHSLDIPKDKITLGSLVLSEINKKEMSFFCNRQFITGQSIVIEFIIPNIFSINAEVLSGRYYNMKGRVLSQRKLNYRTKVKFVFFDDKEKILLERFIRSIEIEDIHIPEPKKDKD